MLHYDVTQLHINVLPYQCETQLGVNKAKAIEAARGRRLVINTANMIRL